MFWEELFDIVCLIMSKIESVGLVSVVVWGVGVSSVGVAVVVDDQVIWIVLDLIFLIIVSVTIGELVRVLEGLEEQVHVVHVDWVVKFIAQLKHSNLTSGVSASAEAEVLDDGVLWISSIVDFLIVGLVAIAKVVRWLVVVHLLRFNLELLNRFNSHHNEAFVGLDWHKMHVFLVQANSRGKP